MNNEKMISAILNDIEYGIRETEKMIRDIDTEFKKLVNEIKKILIAFITMYCLNM